MSFKKMNEKIKKQWVAALESGRYEQTTSTLRENTKGKKYSYCCLGVLCNVVTNRKGWKEENLHPFTSDGANLNKFGLSSTGLSDKCQDKLTTMNDLDGNSFKEIAAWIKKNI